ncbi:GNAT family N-acetyltransferase [uncultured Sphingorhabdus sp.]|uniref:GNAT family N-acetyltransferase n=1 Tax=uncultured Sphingorhabdus sp. TaxID=1686106 RepID=UPI00262EF2D6|nr:GNAT family N-acetyltransferase [uncultured Sphingorhabdus sp.]HMS18937.1 GNAT family N-acetyltransferase [Sphingorhabdus sp.]
MIEIIDAESRDHAQVAETLTQAFHTDPALSYILQDELSRPRRLNRLFDLIIEDDATVGRVVRSSGNEAAALWRAPGKADSDDEPLIAQLLPMLRIFGFALPRAMRVVEGIDKNRPKGDFWYLHFVGVRPGHQGKGWGGRIIREGLARADAGGLPSWLETATPENVPLYQRLGFVIQCEWDVPKGGPHFWGMMRPPA